MTQRDMLDDADPGPDMSDAPELLPCPFCGGEAWGYWGGTHHFVACRKCPAEISSRNRADAVSYWNRRTPDPAAIRAEALEEAARVALRPFLPVDIGGDFICNPTQGECTAAAIRALIAQPAEGGEDRA